MLVPLQILGSKPPLFLVHGLRGITFSIGSRFAAMLGADQPFYLINANGLDGRQPILEYVHDMVVAYLQEIHQARPTGPIRIGGMCAGGFVAIEMARALRAEGRDTGPIILIDPPAIPIGYEKRHDTIDISPELENRFYQELRGRLLQKASDPDGYDDLPFDPSDSKQLHLATMIGARTTVAFARHIPRPFSGSAKVIVSKERARGFFHPHLPWHKLLPGPRAVHVTSYSHNTLFRAGRATLAGFIKSTLEEIPTSETPAEQLIQPAP